MDGWMNAWMDGHIDGWTHEWMDGCNACDALKRKLKLILYHLVSCMISCPLQQTENSLIASPTHSTHSVTFDHVHPTTTSPSTLTPTFTLMAQPEFFFSTA